MVDGIENAPSSFPRALSARIVRRAQTQQQQAGSRLSGAVVVSLSQTAASSLTGDGAGTSPSETGSTHGQEAQSRAQDALGQIKSANDAARAQKKNLLKQHIEELKARLKVMRMMGLSARELARESLKIAKEAGKAARDYAGLGRDTPLSTDTTLTAVPVLVTGENQAPAQSQSQTQTQTQGEGQGAESSGTLNAGSAPGEKTAAGVSTKGATLAWALVEVASSQDVRRKAMSLKSLAQGPNGDGDGLSGEVPKDPDDRFFYEVFHLLGKVRKTLKEADVADRLRHPNRSDQEFKELSKALGEIESGVVDSYTAMSSSGSSAETLDTAAG